MGDTITLKEMMAFFGMSASEFTREWKQMSLQDKTDIKTGLQNGSLSY